METFVERAKLERNPPTTCLLWAEGRPKSTLGKERFVQREKGWEYDTSGSRVITDLSTDEACGCLTSQIGRDVVLSTKYGRTQRLIFIFLEMARCALV